jgi:hypothetical protein
MCVCMCVCMCQADEIFVAWVLALEHLPLVIWFSRDTDVACSGAALARATILVRATSAGLVPGAGATPCPPESPCNPCVPVCLCACVPVCQWIRKWNKFPLKQPRVTGVVLRAVHECLRVVEHRSGRKLAAASDAAVVRTTLHPAQVRPACCATKPASLPSFRQVWPRVCGVRAVRAVRVCVCRQLSVLMSFLGDDLRPAHKLKGMGLQRTREVRALGRVLAMPCIVPPPPVCAHPVLPHCMPSLPSEPPDSPLPLSPGLPLRCLRP